MEIIQPELYVRPVKRAVLLQNHGWMTLKIYAKVKIFVHYTSHGSDHCAKNLQNPPTTVHAVERTRQDVPCCSSFVLKWCLNNPKDIGQGQRSLHATQSPIIMVIFAKYGKNPWRIVRAIEWKWGTWEMEKSSTLLAFCARNSLVTCTKANDAYLWCFLWSAPE